MKLKKGDKIEELTLPSINGEIFSIENIYGKKTLISFYRFATCPFCNLRIFEINKRFSELNDNLEVIAIFDSNIDFLSKNMKKHNSPFKILADENFKYFKKFEIEKSVFKFFLGTAFGFFRFFRAIFKGYIPYAVKGSMLTIPVDILVNEKGNVENVYYGKNTCDHLSFNEIKQFSFGKEK